MFRLFKIAVLVSLLMAAGCNKGKTQDDSANEKADTMALLADSVAELKLPLELPDVGSVDSVSVVAGDSVMRVKLTIEDDYIDSAAIASQEAYQLFVLGLMAESPRMGAVLSLAARVPVGLRVKVGARSSDMESGFSVDASRLPSLAIAAPDLRRRDEVKVFNRVRFDNAECPFEIEDGVTLVSMNVQDRYVTFRTEIDVEKLDFLVMKENRDSVSHAVVSSLRMQLQDSAQRKSLRDISDARFGYRNRYIASDRRDSFDISFTPSDLDRLIAVSDSLQKAEAGKMR